MLRVTKGNLSRKYTLLFLLFILCHIINAQNKIEWSDEYELKIEDFKASAPNTGSGQTVFPSTTIEYSLANYQLAFSNLNSNVICHFLPSSSWLDEGPNTKDLLGFAQVSWDLNELAARKLRKAFRENRMRLSKNMVAELHEKVMAEVTAIQSQYSKETDFGTIPDKQQEWVIKTKNLLDEYSGYCKTCKPPKKKKRKKS